MNNFVADGLAKQDVQTVLADSSCYFVVKYIAELEGDGGNELSFDLLS